MAPQEAQNRRNPAIEMIISAAALLLLFAAAASGASVMYVDDDAPAGGLGNTWETACRSLQDALHAARQADSGVQEIRVAQGVYRPDDGEAAINGDRHASFELDSRFVLLGGYAGLSQTRGDTRDSGQFRTVLSGDLNGDDLPGSVNVHDNSYHVVRVDENADRATIDGFEIRGGNANHPFLGIGRGAGMLIENASPRVMNCTFTENFAANSGGGLASVNGSPEISHVFFDRNIAMINGGGIYFDGGAPRVTHAIFENNASGGAGGGIAVSYSSLSLVNATFFGNNAVMGGAMSNHGWNLPELVNVTMHRNFAQLAGGLFSSYGSVRVFNSILWDNWDYSGSRKTQEIYGDAVVIWSTIRGGWDGAGGLGNSTADPLLDSNLRLSAGSPAIDAGNNFLVPNDIVTDLAGNARLVDDPNSANNGEPGKPLGLNPIVDMGAYEFRPTTPRNRPRGPSIGNTN